MEEVDMLRRPNVHQFNAGSFHSQKKYLEHIRFLNYHLFREKFLSPLYYLSFKPSLLRSDFDFALYLSKSLQKFIKKIIIIDSHFVGVLILFAIFVSLLERYLYTLPNLLIKLASLNTPLACFYF